MSHYTVLYRPQALEIFPPPPERITSAELAMLADALELVDREERTPAALPHSDPAEVLSRRFESWTLRAARDRCEDYEAPARLVGLLSRCLAAAGDARRDVAFFALADDGSLLPPAPGGGSRPFGREPARTISSETLGGGGPFAGPAGDDLDLLAETADDLPGAGSRIARLQCAALERVGELSRSSFSAVRDAHAIYAALGATDCDGGVSGTGAVRRYGREAIALALGRAEALGGHDLLPFLGAARRLLDEGAPFVVVSFC